MVIRDGNITICQSEEIGGAPCHISNPVAILVFCVATIIQSDRRSITNRFSAGIGYSGISKYHSSNLQDANQQRHENGQGDRKLGHRLCAISEQFLFSRRPVHKHCSIYSKKYGSAIPHENRPEEQGRFRYCSPETTPPNGGFATRFRLRVKASQKNNLNFQGRSM
jgi:hypothetical protein